jgi:16S rRNA (guanine966-N2)-methyltransferase
VIRENLRSLGVRSGFEVMESDAMRALRELEQKGVIANYVFLDPPYAEHALYTKALELLSASPMVSTESLVIAEHDRRFDPGEAFGELLRTRIHAQGDSKLSFYRRR